MIFFFTKDPNLNFFSWGGGGVRGGEGGGVGGG